MIQIYRSYNPGSRCFDRYDEMCRECAKKEMELGKCVEFDGHLYRYIIEEEGFSYYLDGSEEIKVLIMCSICGGSLVTDELPILDE